MGKAVVYVPKKVVLLNVDHPDRITNVLESAKVTQYNGKPLVVVPHQPIETAVLRDMGFDIPSPMDTYFEYKGYFEPFPAQRDSAQFISMHPRCFCCNSFGLGKTITTLWAIMYLRSIGYVNRVLVVCPISVMQNTWAAEVFRSFPGVKTNVLYGAKERRLKLLKDEADIYIINSDALGIIKDAMAEREDINMVVIDEVALFRNHSAQRWKFANEICNKQFEGSRRVVGLTGSPIPNLPTDAFGQIKLVTPGNKECPKYFGQFRSLLMQQINQFKWIPKPRAVEQVFRIMQPAIRYAIQDVVDLPPQIFVQRKAELSDAQKKAYKEMFAQLSTEFDNEKVTASNEAIKTNKLLQICCGIAYGADDKCYELDCKSRLEVLDGVLEESEGKVIVFVPFVQGLQRVKEHISETYSAAVIAGDTPKKDRDDIFYSFQNSESPRVIVANPMTMSHGLTLTAATTIVWFSPIFSNEYFQQANARIYRTGQKRSTVVVEIVSTSLEEKVYARLKDKQSVQGLLLDMIKEGAKE